MLSWFTVTITSQLVMAVAICNVNFVNAYMIAYHAHVYTHTSLIHSPNPNPDLSNRVSSKSTGQSTNRNSELTTTTENHTYTLYLSTLVPLKSRPYGTIQIHLLLLVVVVAPSNIMI